MRSGVAGVWVAVLCTAAVAMAGCGGGGEAPQEQEVVEAATETPVPDTAVAELPTATATRTTPPASTPEPAATPGQSPTIVSGQSTATATVPAQPVSAGTVATPQPAAAQPTVPPPAVSTGSAVAALSLGSARVGGDPIEVRDTVWRAGREHFADPSAPQYIAWYERFGRPGNAGANSIFAAHINYVGHGNGPFAFLTSAVVGDLLHVTMADGTSHAYSVQSVRVIPLSQLDMNQVVYPALEAGRERVTLISCGGTFVPNASGVGGDYDSRVVVVAERIVG